MTEENDDKLMQAARQLSRDVSPTHDLWPGIAAAIAQPAPRRFSPMLVQAAAVVLAVGASSMTTYMVMKEQPAPITTVASPSMLFEQTSFGSRHNLGPEFVDARNALVASLAIELERLPQESRANVETNLTLIHEAVFELNEALEQEPGNTLLQERLLRTYREELALIRRVNGLTRNVMMRNDV